MLLLAIAVGNTVDPCEAERVVAIVRRLEKTAGQT